MVRSNLFTIWKQREANLRRSITYKEVAGQTGISTATLRRWMAGTIQRFDAKSIDRLCGFFECEVADLIVRDLSAGEEAAAA